MIKPLFNLPGPRGHHTVAVKVTRMSLRHLIEPVRLTWLCVNYSTHLV